MISPRYRKQVGRLTLFSLLTVGPQLYLRGTNIVTDTYALGSMRFWSGISPYLDPAGASDWFKYSPLFALIYRPLAMLSGKWQALSWGILNAAFFWAGLSRWYLFSRTSPRALWIGLILASMELDGSLRYQQINAALVGIMLWAVADFRDGRVERAGALLAFATNVKILPGLVAMGLAFPIRRNYGQAFVLVSAAALALPALVAGVRSDVVWHREWLALLASDVGKPGLLDIASVFARWGLAGWGSALRFFVLVVTLTQLASARFAEPRRGNYENWLAVALLGLLLVSPRTESPTFVFIGPVYLFCLERWLKNGRPGIQLCVIALSAFLITLSFNDIWPKRLWNPHDFHHATKTLGALLLWCLSVVHLKRTSPSLPGRQNRKNPSN